MSIYSEYKHGYIDKFDFDNYHDPCDYPDEPEENETEDGTPRLIDADALIEAHYDYCCKHHGEADNFYVWSLELMRNAPTIDAVEVVRCKECRFGYPRFTYSKRECRCKIFRGNIFRDDFFCGFAERMEEE